MLHSVRPAFLDTECNLFRMILLAYYCVSMDIHSIIVISPLAADS